MKQKVTTYKRGSFVGTTSLCVCLSNTTVCDEIFFLCICTWEAITVNWENFTVELIS